MAPVPLPPVMPDEGAASPGSEPCTETIHHCSRCSYTTPFKASFLRHTKTMHEPESVANGSNPQEEEEVVVVVKNEAMEPEVIIDSAEDVVKEEPDDESPPVVAVKTEAASPTGKEVLKHGPKYCKSCDISFKHYSTYVAHKQFYCASHTGEIANAATNNNNPTARSTETSVL